MKEKEKKRQGSLPRAADSGRTLATGSNGICSIGAILPSNRSTSADVDEFIFDHCSGRERNCGKPKTELASFLGRIANSQVNSITYHIGLLVV